jgi:dTDP-4-dehydrorhamnose reductase
MNADYVINCIGATKHRTYSDEEMSLLNTFLPHALAEACRKTGAKLIQVSTDCVFDGSRGNYSELDKPDAIDHYGVTKSLGEGTDFMTIRTSIIGKSCHSNPVGFLDMVLNCKGRSANGYSNHKWNGLGNMAYAECFDKIIDRDLYSQGIFHVHSPFVVTKYDLIRMINEKFKLNIEVVKTETMTSIDRSLTTVKELNSLLEIPDIYEQIDQIHKNFTA